MTNELCAKVRMILKNKVRMAPVKITRGHGEGGYRSQASVGRQQIYFIDTEHFRKTQQNCIHHKRATISYPSPSESFSFPANINSKRAHIPGIHDNLFQAIPVKRPPVVHSASITIAIIAHLIAVSSPPRSVRTV